MHVSGVGYAPILLCSKSLGSRLKYISVRENGYRYIRRWSEGDTSHWNLFATDGWMDGSGGRGGEGGGGMCVYELEVAVNAAKYDVVVACIYINVLRISER